ncbi:MAG: IS3 family transposase [Clostridia bacterium]|nr:IS3 family transposase [Clostridia bacterium]
MHIKDYKLDNMCATLEINKRTYYKYRNTQDKDYYDYLLIKEIFDESKKTYGYRRICDGLLIKYGVIFNHKKVQRIMAKYALKPEYIKRIRPNYNAKRIEENVKPNLLKRNFKTNIKNKVWLTDITYLIFNNKRAYLSTIIDLYDRRVVAYRISKFNNLSIVTDTLNQALAKEKDVHNLIIHSDQGFQYTSHEYKVVCEANGITISMSRKGTPIDDSPMESFHSILKKETLYNNYITNLEEYIAIVEDWLEFYNTKRLKNRKKT